MASVSPGAWRSLVSDSRWPPGASHSGASCATRRRMPSPSAQRGGQRLEEVALENLAADGGDVAAGAPDRDRIEVGGVQLDLAEGRGERHTERPRATAQVHDDGPGLSGGRLAGEGNGLADQELGAAAGHEDAGVHGDPQAAELRPAEDVLERLAGGPPVQHGGQGGRCPRRGDEQPRLVLGEDAARGPEPGDGGRPVMS